MEHQISELNRKLDLLADRLTTQKIQDIEVRLQKLETSSGNSENLQKLLDSKNQEIRRLQKENANLKARLGLQDTVAESTVAENTVVHDTVPQDTVDQPSTSGVNYKKNQKKKNKKKSKTEVPPPPPRPDPHEMMMNIFNQFQTFGGVDHSHRGLPASYGMKVDEIEIPGLRNLNGDMDDATYFSKLREILEAEGLEAKDVVPQPHP